MLNDLDPNKWFGESLLSQTPPVWLLAAPPTGDPDQRSSSGVAPMRVMLPAVTEPIPRRVLLALLVLVVVALSADS